jgi:ElaB/YqjD/DUF883 family membrane-anchored ribosome-binding protein
MIFGTLEADPVNLGIDWDKAWEDVKTAAKELPGELLKKTGDVVEAKAVQAVQPTVQAQVEKKAARVVSKGNIALTAAIGGTAGVLIAGGSWQRRAMGATVGLVLGGLAGLKIGLISDVT